MLYARFTYPDNGWDADVERAKEAGLKVDEKYEVENISMGQSNTKIYLKEFTGCFNSVQFEFEEENGAPVNIYKDRRYNPYML